MIVRDPDVVARDGVALVQGHCNAVHAALAHRAVMRAGQVDSDRDAFRARMEGGGDRSEAFCEHRAGSAMEQSVWLRIAGDRHAAGDPSWHHIGDLDAHALHERAGVRPIEECSELLDRGARRGRISLQCIAHPATVGLSRGLRA